LTAGLRRLGSGGMSEVFLARPADPARAAERVAVKRLLPELAEFPDFVALFERETRVASRLNHPNVVRVTLIRAFHFCLTAGLVVTAWG
jgi:serine/threonine protein kinase